MKEKLERYLELQRQRYEIQRKHNLEDSEEEDAIMDIMDDVWYSLSDEEQNELNKHIVGLDQI